MSNDGKVQWFGLKPFGAVCEEDNHAVTPVGGTCNWCDETIEASDSGMLTPHMALLAPEVEGDFTLEACYLPYHQECMMRQVLGSYAHIRGKCSCFSEEPEPDSGMSKREEARKVYELWCRGKKEGALLF